MQHSDWSDYQAFLAVARAGRLVSAASAVGVDPTTLGRRIRRLEARLKRSLFEQTREGQTLTEAGEALLVEVESMAHAASRIGEFGSLEGGPSGTLRVSLSEGFGTWFVARHLGEFVDRYPGITLDLVASSGFLSPSKREADIAVVLSRPRAGPLVAGKLSDYELRLYATADYLTSHPHIVRSQDLAEGHNLIGYIPDLLYAPELRYLAEIHPGLSATLRSSSINAQHQIISAGTGIGVLPCFIGNADPTLQVVLPAVSIRRTFWMVRHKDTHQLARVRAFKGWLSALAQRHKDRLLPISAPALMARHRNPG